MTTTIKYDGLTLRTASQRRFVAFHINFNKATPVARSDSYPTLLKRVNRELPAARARSIIVDTTRNEVVRDSIVREVF